jgi:two-component system NtrC family sensor kinase
MEAGLRHKNIRVEFDFAPDLPRPLLSPDQVRQVLLNLFKNAEDAIAESGYIRITTMHEEAEGEEFVILKVSDNGCGITDEDQSQIFEPFFTRKRDGQGTGLGLSVTYSIIRNIGGKIEVDSRVGEGTTFTIRIPVAPDRAAIVIE